MAVFNALMCRNSIARLTAFVVLLALPSSALSDPAIPGQTWGTLFPTFGTPLGLGYDKGNTTLYVIFELPNGNGDVFGIVDQNSGAFTQLGQVLPLHSVTLPSTSKMSIDTMNQRAIIPRWKDLLIVDLKSHSPTIEPPLQNTTAIAPFFYDSQSGQLFASPLSSADLYSVNIPTGALTPVTDRVIRFPEYVPTAIDSIHHIFYAIDVDAANQYAASLYAIDETNGHVSPPLSIAMPLAALAFDSSAKVLYGITYCCANINQFQNPEFVKVDTATGDLTPIATVGEEGNLPYEGNSGGLDDGDRFFFPFESSLQALDVTPNRGWYVEIEKKGKIGSTFFQWIYDAGASVGLRAQQVTSGQALNVILEFGEPATGTENGKKVYGASGYTHFISVANIQMAALNFVMGFKDNVGSSSATQLNLTLGTLNEGEVLTGRHGAAWAAMVSATQTALQVAGLSSNVHVFGGMDLELAYSKTAPLANWVQGYGSLNYVDFGDAQGCVIGKSTCDNSWNMSDVAKYAGANVVPQIYNTLGHQAKSWIAVSLYAQSASGQPLHFVAPLSEAMACFERPSGCFEKNNTPSAAWQQLHADLAKTFGPNAASLSATTDMEHRIP